MSIRFRLTLLYCLILALTFIVFDTALFFTASNNTLVLVDEALAAEELRVVGSPAFRLDRADYSFASLAASETFIQLRSLDGDVLDRTGNLGTFAIPMTAEVHERVRQGFQVIETVQLEGERLRVLTQRVSGQSEGEAGIIQVGRSLAEHDQSLNTLRRLLLTGSLVGTVIAFGFGWILAGAALDPLQNITKTAQTIGRERSFNRRVDYSGPNDELGWLAHTFNNMVEELNAAYQNADQTLQTQRRFVADASHELRTPLTTLRGNLELLRRDPPIQEDDRVAVINDMVDECERLIRLVNDLLVLARSDTGYHLQRSAVAIRQVVDELCRQAHLLHPHREVICDAVRDITVYGNRDALKQALLIFIDNALKYTPGPITIDTLQHNERVTIRVIDAGPGIRPELLPHIFERFYQVDDSRSGGGSGLGLSIAKTLVEAQDGIIEVQSQAGQGSTFMVTLPQA